MDLVRKILSAYESDRRSECWITNIEGYDAEHVKGHTRIMLDAGLLINPGNPVNPRAGSLGAYISWEGYEFLEASRDDTVWERAKRAAGASGGIAFGVLKAVLSAAGTAEALRLMNLK